MNRDVHDGRWPSALGTPKTVGSRGAVRWVIAGLAVVAGAALAGGIPAEAAPVTVRAGATPTYSTARAPALSIASSQAPVPVREVREYIAVKDAEQAPFTVPHLVQADNYANAEAVIDGKLLPGDPGYVQACLASVQGTSRDPEQGTRISRQMGAALDATGNGCRNLRGRPPGPVWRSSLCTSVPRRCGHTSAAGNLTSVPAVASRRPGQQADLRPVPPDGPLACVCELLAIEHERGAWVGHVLTHPGHPDIDSYLNAAIVIGA